MKKINESFTCVDCQRLIPPAAKTCRNHCPHCFTSLHVDGDIPGDRNTACGGIMRPIQMKTANGQTKILFLCTKCRKEHWNKLAEDDEREALMDTLAKAQDLLLYL